MKKRLLFALMAMCVAVSGFALSVGEYVYTPQGRFMITGQNVASSNFADFTGWTVVSATEGKTIDQAFNINTGGYSESLNSASSVDDAVAGEGISFKFEPGDAGKTYVVSYKLKGTATTSIRVKTTEVATNLVQVFGEAAPAEEGGAPVVNIVNTAEQLSEDWQTFNYAIQGDGTGRTYYISFTGMATSIEIADLQIAEAKQVADLRQRDAMLEKLNAYINCYEWSEDVLEDNGLTEAVEGLNAIVDNSSQQALKDALDAATGILADFLKAEMDDYLAGDSKNYLPIKSTNGNDRNFTNFGIWTCTPENRSQWEKGNYLDMGHFQHGTKWCSGNPDNPMGLSTQKDLSAGSYVFTIDVKAAIREPKSKCWTLDDGMKPAYGIAYISKIVDGAEPEVIVSKQIELDPLNFTTFVLGTKIAEDGKYEFGMMAYCKDTHKDLSNGSVVYVKDASIWGKNENEYNQKQLGYYADVVEQITTGRKQLTTAAEYIANADYLWGKSELQACVDSIAPRIEAYEALDQATIIATYDNFDDEYKKSTSDSAGIMVYEVYQTAVKYIIAANKKFEEVNKTLNSIQDVIDNAEATLALRIYDAATGKDALKAAIDKAKGVQAEMKATQYSEENDSIIVAANKELNAAIETFKTTIPVEAIATIVDIDFETPAVLNTETSAYSIAGAAGAMEFTHFSEVNPEGEDSPFQQGFWDGGEQKWKGYLRVGNGTATVNFDPTSGTNDMGTNILKVTCDFYIQGLSNRYIGFTLKNEADSTLAGLRRNYYNGTDTENTFNADMSKVWAKSGSNYEDKSPADVEEPTANPLEKTNFEVIMDYGAGTMYVNIASSVGSTTSTPVAFTGIPAKFVLECNYDNKFMKRRCWFDNLKIQRITAGAYDGIADVNAAAKVVMPKKVIKNGRIVINGKYGVNGIIIRK